MPVGADKVVGRWSDALARHWTISAKLAAEVGILVRDYVVKAAVDFPYYPSITWTLEWKAFEGTEREVTVPAAYSLGIIRQDELHHLIAIKDETFGYIAFEPSNDDLASTRRVIDRVGDDVVVR